MSALAALGSTAATSRCIWVKAHRSSPPTRCRQEYDLTEPDAWSQHQDFGHGLWRDSLIWGEDLHKIAILTPRLIWGKDLSKGYGPGLVVGQAGVANRAISLKNCRNVTLRDFSILHGGHFGILATGADNFVIDNLKIDTNHDLIDIDRCRNARVSNSSVNSLTLDDAIHLQGFRPGFQCSPEQAESSSAPNAMAGSRTSPPRT